MLCQIKSVKEKEGSTIGKSTELRINSLELYTWLLVWFSHLYLRGLS